MPYKSTIDNAAGITENKLRLLLLIIIVAITFYRPVAVFPDRLELVIDGKACSVIVVPGHCSDKTRAAAEDLRNCVLKMSGADIPLLSEDTAVVPAEYVPVYVGDTNYARSRGIDTLKISGRLFRSQNRSLSGCPCRRGKENTERYTMGGLRFCYGSAWCALDMAGRDGYLYSPEEHRYHTGRSRYQRRTKAVQALVQTGEPGKKPGHVW